MGRGPYECSKKGSSNNYFNTLRRHQICVFSYNVCVSRLKSLVSETISYAKDTIRPPRILAVDTMA